MKNKILSILLTLILVISIFPVSAFADTPYGRIAFNSGGGTGEMETVEITQGSTFAVPDSDFTWYLHEFTGWLGTDGNTYMPGDTISVSSSSTNTLGLIAQWEEIEEDTSVTPEDGVIDIYIKAGETLTLKDLPASSAYQVWEETPDGWVLVEQSNTSGYITPLETSETEFRNKYQPDIATIQFSGTKTLDGKAAGAGDFSFILKEGSEIIETASTLDGGFFQFSVIEYDSDNIGTHTYTISEVDPEDDGIDYDKHIETVTVVVADDGEGNLTATATYDADGLKFANSTRPGQLKITKEAEGLTDANKNDVFTFKVTLNNQDGMPFGEGDEVYWYYEGDSTLSRAAKRIKVKVVNGWNDIKGWFSDTFGSSKEEVNEVEVVEESTEEIISESVNTQMSVRKVPTANNNLLGAGNSSNPPVKYAVSVYGIEEAVDDKGHNMGLTFGPALGANYINSYKSHTPTGLTDDGSPHRCIHDDDWATIIFWNDLDPYVYEQCISKDCTHSIELNLSDTLRNPNFVPSYTGDGPSILYYELFSPTGDTYQNLRWNPINNGANYGTNKDGWGASRIRAMLNGSDALTMKKGSYNYYNNLNITTAAEDYTSDNALISAFPEELQNAIGYQAVKYDSVYNNKTAANLKTSYDKLWLFTSNELGDTVGSTYYNHPLEASAPYSKFVGSGDAYSSNTKRVGYYIPDQNGGSSGSTYRWWLRSSNSNLAVSVLYVVHSGGVSYSRAYDFYGVAPGFSLSTTYQKLEGNKTRIIYDALGGYSEKAIEWQSSEVRRPGYLLLEWNTKADRTGTSYQEGDNVEFIPDETLILYAIWEADTRVDYTVKHYQQNTTLDGYTLVETENRKDEPGETLEIPAKEYAGFITPALKTETIEEDLVVEYYYDRLIYDIAFDGNGATSGQMQNLDMIGAIAKNLTANGYSKKGSIFTGWNTKADGTGDSYTDKQSVNNLATENNETVTLYAQWLDNSERELEPTEGVIYVTAKAGQTVIIPDLPAGTTYSIEELNIPDGWRLEGITGSDGSIPANSAAEATAKNKYYAEGDAILEAHKTINGSTPVAGEFTFELLDENGDVIDTKSNLDIDTDTEIADGDNTKANPWVNTAPVIFDSISYNQDDIGKTFTYTVREVAGDNPAISYDAHTETITVFVYDAGSGILETTVAYDADGTLFTNELLPGSLRINKEIVNATETATEAEFEFTISLLDAEGNALTGEYPVTKYSAEEQAILVDDGEGNMIDSGQTEEVVKEESLGNISDGDIVSFKVDEYIVITGLPHGATYSITESEKEGWNKTNAEGDSGSIAANSESEATFENTYSTSGSVHLEGNKVFTGGSLEEKTFAFVLTDNNGETLYTAETDENGIFFFDIDYAQEDDGNDFVYYIKEVSEECDTIKFDDRVYEVGVQVRDNGAGELVCTVSYPDGDIAFENVEYHKISVAKEVTGSMGDKSKEWEFTLTIGDNEGEDITYTKGSDTGVVEFDEGEYTFTLSSGETITFSNIVFGNTYSLTEVDSNKDGYITKTEGDGRMSKNILTNIVTVSGTLEDDNKVIFNNNKDTVVPTLIRLTNIPLVNIGFAVILLGSLIFIIAKKRKKN